VLDTHRRGGKGRDRKDVNLLGKLKMKESIFESPLEKEQILVHSSGSGAQSASFLFYSFFLFDSSLLIFELDKYKTI